MCGSLCLAKVRKLERKGTGAEDTLILGGSRKSLPACKLDLDWKYAGRWKSREYTDWSDSSPVTVTKYSSLHRWFSKKSLKTKVAHMRCTQKDYFLDVQGKSSQYKVSCQKLILCGHAYWFSENFWYKLIPQWTMRPKCVLKPRTSCIRHEHITIWQVFCKDKRQQQGFLRQLCAPSNWSNVWALFGLRIFLGNLA